MNHATILRLSQFRYQVIPKERGQLMICELLRTTKDGQVPIAIIRFQNGEISVDPLGKNKSQEYIDHILEVRRTA